ncbi:surface protease GP63 [Trypanosoma cruzi]|nr:surface protease GP63 [Trypanosoma cruzi]
MHLRALDALQVCSGVWKDPWVPVRIKTSKTDPCDVRKDCVFSWSHAMNLLNGNRHCEDDVTFSAHGNILAEEAIPAAVKPHADRLLVRPLEGPLSVSSFATGSVCGWFKVPDEHRSAGVANSDMVQCVAAALGGVWALPCVTLEDGRPIAGTMQFTRQFYFTDASTFASPRTCWPTLLGSTTRKWKAAAWWGMLPVYVAGRCWWW